MLGTCAQWLRPPDLRRQGVREADGGRGARLGCQHRGLSDVVVVRSAGRDHQDGQEPQPHLASTRAADRAEDCRGLGAWHRDGADQGREGELVRNRAQGFDHERRSLCVLSVSVSCWVLVC